MKEYSVRETEHGFQLVQNGLPIAFFDRERHPFPKLEVKRCLKACETVEKTIPQRLFAESQSLRERLGLPRIPRRREVGQVVFVPYMVVSEERAEDAEFLFTLNIPSDGRALIRSDWVMTKSEISESAPSRCGLRFDSEAWSLLHELAMLHEPGDDADRDEWWTFYCGIRRITEKMVGLLAKTAKKYGYKKRMADEDKERNP